MKKTAQHSPAYLLRQAAFELAAVAGHPVRDDEDSVFLKFDRKLQQAAMAFAEWKVKRDHFEALLELGAVNAHEVDRVMRGRVARAEPPGLKEALRKVKRTEKKRDLIAPREKAPRLSTRRLQISKLTPFQKEVLGYVYQYGHSPIDSREAKVMLLFVEHGLIERCHVEGKPKRQYRLTEHGHEVWSFVSREKSR